MKKLVGVVVGLLMLLVLFPVINSESETYNELSDTQTFTATEVLATPEVVTLDNTPDSVTKVTVNGVELTVTTEYTVSGDAVTILANNSETDDTIIVYYEYTYDAGTSIDSVMSVFGIIVLIGGVAWFTKEMFLTRKGG